MRPSSSVRGIVVDPFGSVGVADVPVRWVAGEPCGRSWELGRATSGPDGRFAVELSDDDSAREGFCRLEVRSGARAWLEPELGAGEAARVDVDPRQPESVVRLPREGPATPEGTWRALADDLVRRRALTVADLVGELVAPAPGGVARGWSAGVRSSALRELLEAVAREDRRAADANELLYDSAFVETAALSEGRLDVAVRYYEDRRNVEQLIERTGSAFPVLPRSDLELYRDYLRELWVAAALKMHHDHASAASPAPALLERQLAWRFEQDFRTSVTGRRPAAQLVADVLRAVLVRPRSVGGVGLAPAAVPARGTLGDEEYLAELVRASGLSAAELRKRFRVAFERAPGEQRSPVELNVEALVGLLTDTYQSPEEPFVALPSTVERPLLFGPHVGRAPFFLHYEEWLEQRRFFPESVYDPRRNLPVFGPNYRELMVSQKGGTLAPGPEGYFASAADRTESIAWIERLFPIVDGFRAALAQLDAQDFRGAHGGLLSVRARVNEALGAYRGAWVRDVFAWPLWSGDPRVSLKARAAQQPRSLEELQRLEGFFDPPYFPPATGQIGGGEYDAQQRGMAQARTLYLHHLLYLANVLLPYYLAQVASGLGDSAGALALLGPLTGCQVGVGDATLPAGHAPPGRNAFPNLHAGRSLPYTVALDFGEDGRESFAPFPPGTSLVGGGLAAGRLALPRFEHAFFRLAQGDAMLAWADEQYRSDQPASIRRARELYKGVLFLHGEDPAVHPDFPRPGGLLGLPPGLLYGDPLSWRSRVNPAVVAQIHRARAALFQIEQGLNAYGYRDDLVPLLRYRPLKLAADAFALAARGAQTDFLTYQGNLEQAQLEAFHVQNLVRRAESLVGIAGEREEIARAGVARAREQVAAVEAQVAAKRAEIADAGGFFSQLGDFFGGMKDSLTGMVPLAGSVASDGAAAGAVDGGQLLGVLKGGAGGGAAAKDALVATLGSGAALTLGFGAFAYYGYSSMSSLEAAYAKRAGDLRSLEQQALPAAREQVRLRERDVTIAGHEVRIAQADLEHARSLQRFHQDRFLGAELWRELAAFAQRLMRRYVELGARAAWMAERALAFEQHRPVDVVRLNYLPRRLRGVTGADRLLADLAELEASRLEGVRLTTPVVHTISLAREHPLAFGTLKRTGRCRFRTEEAALRAAYPGTYGYRVRAVTAAAHATSGPAPRGVLRNGGVSLVGDETGAAPARLVRPPDALPLSEFRLKDDLFVFGLPGETLLQFEGSGYETDWELELPAAANPGGLRDLLDVLVTFDLNARWSDGLATALAAAPPAPVSRALLVPVSAWDPAGLRDLRGGAPPARLRFDLTRVPLGAREQGRSVSQLALLLVGPPGPAPTGTLTAQAAGVAAAVSFAGGVARSNAGVLAGGPGPSPLNELVGLPLEQVLELELDGPAAELARVDDVALWVEYTALV